MNESSDMKVERSLPTTSRVNVVSLAQLDTYWSENQVNIKTMSQLVSWSIDLLKDILIQNGKISERVLGMNTWDAVKYLELRGLYQSTTNKRGKKKLATAIRFDSMREEGRDPRGEDKRSYNVVHNKSSIKPCEAEAVVHQTSDEEWEAIKKKIEEEKAKEARAEAARQIAEAKADGRLNVVGSRFDCVESSIPEKDKDIIAKENDTASQLEFLKSRVVKGGEE